MNKKRTKIIALVLVYLVLSTTNSAGKPIIANGIEFNIDQNTILLDREGIYGDPLAFIDPIAAFDKINEIGKDATLLVAPSVYWLDDPDDPSVRTDKDGTPFGIRIKCDNLKIIGLSENPQDVVFAVNRGQTQGAVGNYTMFEFKGNSLEADNITFGNYCNIDLDYPRNPELNRPRRKDAIVQAQIGICNGTDKLFARNCQFLSRLNLCPFVGARRSLYDNCYFESTDDALSGSAVYLDCRFLFCSSKPFYSTDQTGAVFLNCDIKSLCDGPQYFTKVPGQITAIDTRFSGNDNLTVQWTRDASDKKCFQHNILVNGKPYTIDSSRNELWMELAGKNLMDAYVFEYNGKKYYNLSNLLNGDDGWDPKGMNVLVKEAEIKLGKKLTGIPVTMIMRTDKASLAARNDTAIITATPLLWGGYPTDKTKDIVIVSDNNIPETKQKIVSLSLPNGLTACQTITMLPLLRKAPKIKKQPKVKYDASNGLYYVDYKLNGKGIDNSMIYWARIILEEDGKKVLMVKKGARHKDYLYRPTSGDFGNKLMAIVMPKFSDSEQGEMVLSDEIEVSNLDYIKDFPESELNTDFSDIPISEINGNFPGIWNFDIYKPLDTNHVTNWKAVKGAGWYYGKGFDASVSEGLVQSERGARLSYIPTRDVCKNMKVRLTVEPAKSGGQGFGSATAQYMDVCLKFDPENLDGYALRIERTPDYDSAVRFSLVKYEKGNTSVINEGVVSNCYRTACHINAEIRNGVLTATAHTDAPQKEAKSGIVSNVSISSPVDDSGLTGFCIQHTGSTGPSSTLIKNLSLQWD